MKIGRQLIYFECKWFRQSLSVLNQKSFMSNHLIVNHCPIFIAMEFFKFINIMKLRKRDANIVSHIIREENFSLKNQNQSDICTTLTNVCDSEQTKKQ